MIRVLLVDDHAIVRAGYARLLALEADLQVVGEAPDADSAYAMLQRNPEMADVMLLDLSMPGRSGFDLIRRARQRCPGLAVLVCTMHDAAPMVANARAAGAAGFMTKASDPALLADAIRRVHAGEQVLSPDVASAPSSPAAQSPQQVLSPREFDVLIRLARGESLDTIAAALSVSPKTVANLQSLIRAKLGLANSVELLAYARAHGLAP